MGAALQEYVDAVPPKHRPLFDRVYGLIERVAPDAELSDLASAALR